MPGQARRCAGTTPLAGVAAGRALGRSCLLAAGALLILLASPGPHASHGQESDGGARLRTAGVDDIPYHVSMIVGASVLTMRGRDTPEAIWPVRIAAEARAALREPEFRYEGFTLVATGLASFDEPTTDPETASLSAVLDFVDDAGRRASVALLVGYGFTGEWLEIRGAEVVTLAPTRPEVRVFIVPADEFPAGALQSEGDGLELLRAAVENASREPSPLPREYYIFAFSANRLPLDAVIELRLSDTPEGIEGHPGNSVQLDHQGWRTAVMRGTFARTAGEEFFIKAIYRPGAGTPIEERPPRLVAVVSSRGATVAVENAETVTAPALELDLAPRTGQADEIVAADDRQGVKRRLMEIEELLELKLITPEEFAKKRQQILDDL